MEKIATVFPWYFKIVLKSMGFLPNCNLFLIVMPPWLTRSLYTMFKVVVFPVLGFPDRRIILINPSLLKMDEIAFVCCIESCMMKFL